MKIRYVADRNIEKKKAEGWREIKGEPKNGLVLMELKEPTDKVAGDNSKKKDK